MLATRTMQRLQPALAAADAEIRPLLDAIDVEDVARNNRGYSRYSGDRFHHFVELERARFIKAASWIVGSVPRGRICDLGCFVPYLPLVLANMGYEVTIVDRYEFFSPAFRSEVSKVANRAGMQLRSLDILNDDLGVLGSFDVVLLMAVVEHLHGSPRRLMQGIRGILEPGGVLLFEVPNIAEFRRRLAFLRGRSPLPEYATYFESEYPFFGHSREMTVDEVRYLHANTRFRIERLDCYDYSATRNGGMRQRVVRVLKRLTPLPNKGESIMALARPQE